jgi:DNA-binding MarR family transcriptional regulator
MKAARYENYGLIVRHVGRAFTRVLQDGLAPFGITAGEFRVLRVIEEGPRMQSEIGQLAAMDRPFVAALIKKLTLKGLLAARPNETDRRRVDVQLTSRGARTLERITADIIAESNVIATKGITADELRIFTDVSRRMAANIERAYFAAAADDA